MTWLNRHAARAITMLLCAAALWPVTALGSSGGITGASNAPGCNSCHGSQNVSLVPGTGYALTGTNTVVEGRTGSYSSAMSGLAKAGGFNVSAASGTLIAGAGSRLVGTQLTHNARTTPPTFNFSWTAPSVGSSITTTLSGCSQYVNSNGNADAGDGPYGCATKTINITKDTPPTAIASVPAVVNEGASVALTGDTSGDDFAAALTYQWTRTAGPAVTIINPTSANASFTAPAVAANTTVSFTLTVTESDFFQQSTVSTPVTVTINNAPTANAGPVQTVCENSPCTTGGSATIVTLTGAASSDSGGSIVSRQWTQTLGPAVTLSNTSAVAPTFAAPAQALNASTTYRFQLVVTDNDGATDAATVDVTVQDVAFGNSPPTANAGTTQHVNEGAAVTLDGSASTDPENGPLTFTWVRTDAGPPVVLTGAATATPHFTAPVFAPGVPGATLTFRLTVTDNALLTSVATVNVVVNNGPTANAGPDATAAERTTVHLDGSASRDPDGVINSYHWTQLSGPAITLSNAANVAPTFVAPAVGVAGASVVLQLDVTDDGPNGGLTASANVTITITNVNAPPVADAGVNATVNENTAVTLDGTASSDPDGQVATYTWTQINGADVHLQGAKTARPAFTAPEVTPDGLAITFGLTVADAQGLTASSQVTISIGNVNRAPKADAGPNQTVPEATAVTLSAANSSDDDGPLTYRWTQTGGARVTIAGAASIAPTFTAPRVPVDGEALTFTVRVTDQEGLSGEDTVIVNVSDTNTPPVADAGVDAVASEGARVVLDGRNSVDPDAPQGTIVSYAWVQIAGPAVALTNPASTQPSFHAPIVGPAGASLTFRLTVKDNAGAMNDDTVIVNVSNIDQIPVANAGPNQSVTENALVALNGTNSFDADGPIASYLWSQTAGPSVTLSDATSAQPTFRAPPVRANTALVFQLQVTDSHGMADTDTVTINVIDVGGTPPVANAGKAQQVSEAATVQLDAGASTDPDGRVVSYLWRQLRGANVTLSDPMSAKPTFLAPLVVATGATLEFEVTVTDDDRLTDTAAVMITVSNVAVPPIASAGNDRTVTEGATVTLDGASSSDSGGSIVSYQWAQLSGPAVTLSNAGTRAPTFVAPAIAANQSGTVLKFSLTVTDDDGLLAADDIAVTEQDNGITQFPTDVVTLTTVAANRNVGLRSAPGANIVALGSVDPATITDQRNRPASLPNGLISATVRTPTAGASIDIVYFLDTPAPAGSTWVKYSPSQGWVDFGSHAVFNADRSQVTVTLTDGGPGDDDGAANGVIVDPGGPGSFTRATGTPGAGNGGFQNGSSGGGCAIATGDTGFDPLLALLALLAAARVAAIWPGRRRQQPQGAEQMQQR